MDAEIRQQYCEQCDVTWQGTRTSGCWICGSSSAGLAVHLAARYEQSQATWRAAGAA